MANRYANLVGSNKIKDEYTKINTGFDLVQADMDAKAGADDLVDLENTVNNHIGAGDNAHATATTSSAGFMSAADKQKLDSVETGAEANQNAFAKVNDLEADDPSDEVTISGGTGITVTTNPNTKEVIVTATGEATPGPHGSSHTEHGADPIPNATPSEGGLMSAADKTKLDGMDGRFEELAGEGWDGETVKGNADALAAHLAESAKKHIHESGSNANGNYIRFDDGSQICWHNLLLTRAAGTEGQITSPWTFPASFISIPNVIHQLSTENQNIAPTTDELGLARCGGTTTTATFLHQHRVAGRTNFVTGNEARTRAIAVGRWK